MIFDFHSLPDKLKQLVDLLQTLRSENAALRSELALLRTENARLAQRMQEAHERVTRLLASLPADAEASAAINREAA